MKILRSVHSALIEHALDDSPSEACGFIGVTDGVIGRMLLATNVAAHPRHTFSISAQEHYDLSNAILFDCYELGVYHSHPRGPATLSGVDLLYVPRPYDATWLHLLADLSEEAAKIHAFRISSAGAEEEELKVIE